MRVLVTRPAAQAHDWVSKLRAADLEAEALPLIDIVPPADTAAVAAAWPKLADASLVFFVSPNAVLHFFALKPAQIEWPPGLLAASPGPGTSLAAAAQGVARIVEPAFDSEQFDSEALWLQLRDHPWSGRRVTIVRGTGGRDWLAERLREAGAEIEYVAAYRRSLPQLSMPERTLLADALAAPRNHLWLFSSSQAIDHLEAMHAGIDWSASRALATHPSIAERARRLGMREVVEARPALAQVVACIQSIAS